MYALQSDKKFNGGRLKKVAVVFFYTQKYVNLHIFIGNIEKI